MMAISSSGTKTPVDSKASGKEIALLSMVSQPFTNQRPIDQGLTISHGAAPDSPARCRIRHRRHSQGDQVSSHAELELTAQMFAPTMRAMEPSFNRTHLRDSILKANTDPDRLHMSSAMNRLSLLQLFASRGMVPNDPDADDDDDAPVGRPPNCETQ
jgi:hypothetical protein